MLRLHKSAISESEKEELREVQKRLDVLEPKVDRLGLQLKLIRREK